METLQKLVPFFQELLQDWYQLTLHNQEYAICLAISVWLLTAIFYSIRIGFFKRSNAQLLNAQNLLQTSVTEAEAQLQVSQQQLTEAVEKLQQAEQKTEAEALRAAGIEQRLSRSNQQLATSLSSLVDCFELTQDKLPTAEADNLLNEYAAVISRVAERFQNEQQAKTQLQLTMHAEAAKMAEKESLLESLQSRLDTQTQQLVKLEMAVEKYAAAERQMELDQLQFAQDRKHQQAEATRMAELEKQTLASAQNQPKAVVVDKSPSVSPFAAKSIEKVIEKPVTPQPISTQQVSEKNVAPEPKPAPVQAPKVADSKKSKGFFGRAMEKISKLDEKLGQPSAQPILEETAEAAPVTEVTAAMETAVESITSAVAVEPTQKSAAGLNQKLTGLFSGMKKSAAKIEPEISALETMVEPVVEAVSDKPVASAEKAASKLSGMFGKFKSKK